MSRWIALLFAFTVTGSASADDALAPIRDAPKLEPISVKGRTGVPVVLFTRVVSTIPEQEESAGCEAACSAVATGATSGTRKPWT
jgi:hypothetical protein